MGGAVAAPVLVVVMDAAATVLQHTGRIVAMVVGVAVIVLVSAFFGGAGRRGVHRGRPSAIAAAAHQIEL